MKTILVPTDFSKLSITSVYYAIGLAKEINAKIIILNVINGVLSGSSLNTWKKIDEEMINDAHDQATRLLEEITNKHGIINISYSHVLGFPVKDAVEEFATQHHIDFIVMGSKYLGSDINFAWPSAEIAVMGAQGAVNILYRKELAESKNQEATRADLITEYTEKFSNPYLAAERGTIDSVIEPEDSRQYITKAFRTLKTKRDTLPARKHGNIPL
jgi:nucleotide-binding universal stress UspA family protein